MRKVLVLFVVGVILFGAISVQNANAQNVNITQRIIGTWVDSNEDTWVFNANGTLTYGGVAGIKFGVTDTQLAISFPNAAALLDINVLEIYNISMSSDGRTLILIRVDGRVGNWLTKR
jgi:hypothetical protein